MNQLSIKYSSIIWDMDGTILDSMPYWENVGNDYLLRAGVTPPENLKETIEMMTIEESAEYFMKEFHIPKSVDEIVQDIYRLMEENYRSVIPPKKGVVDYIRQQSEKGIRMCLLTSSGQPLAEEAMRRIGVLGCLDAVLTSDNLGMNKRSGAIYEKACEMLDYDIARTVVYEDTLFAVKAAKETKASVVGVYDAYSGSDWEEIAATADFVETFD